MQGFFIVSLLKMWTHSYKELKAKHSLHLLS